MTDSLIGTPVVGVLCHHVTMNDSLIGTPVVGGLCHHYRRRLWK